MLSGRDKLYHITACATITCITFFGFIIVYEIYKKIVRIRGVEEYSYGSGGTNNGDDVEMAMVAPAPAAESTDNSIISIDRSRCTFRRQCPKKYLIMAGLSGIVAMAVGIAKEIGDMYNVWPPCQTPTGCHASWGDMLANFIGVALGEVIVVLSSWLRSLMLNYGRIT